MTSLRLWGQAARRFGDDLEASGDGVKRTRVSNEAADVQTLGEDEREIDIEQEVAQAGAFEVRKRRWHRPSLAGARSASGHRGGRHRPVPRTGQR